MIQQIRIELLDRHPDNPRFQLNEEVIAAIYAQLSAAHRFDDMYAIIVRRLKERYQIIDGHHRVEAAKRDGMRKVPSWVCRLTDQEAFLQLALANTHSGLTPLERGKHAHLAITRYGKNGASSLAEYARTMGRPESSVRDELMAYEVYNSAHVRGIESHFRHLRIIHTAPRPEWRPLAKRMVDENWSVDETRQRVRSLLPREEPKEEPILEPVPTATAPKPKPEPGRLKGRVVLLSEWEKWSETERRKITEWPQQGSGRPFNRQETDSIEWAQWSWNPVTGCLHNCPYCYARDIADRYYEQGFQPSVWPERMAMPSDTPLPREAATDIAHKNVFTCSMADLFGKWVPREWIELVLSIVRANPQWNFLFLTKFPIRMAEFEYPDNAWLGTTVDLQARVKNAERAMRNVKASVKWLSLEPLIEPLQFEDLSAFQWVVIGGASPSSQTPAWRPPHRWIWELSLKALDAGCLVYHKTNLAERPRMFPGQQAAAQPNKAPAPFQYLKTLQ